MSYKNANQAEQLARNEMEVATARVLDQMGFTHGTTSTVDLLSDVAVRYIRKMCQNIRSVSDHGGRSGASIGDVEYAYSRMSIDVDEMNDFLRQNLPLQPRLIPRFPVALPRKEQRVTHIAPTEDMPEHFPSWAPPLYATGMTTVASNNSTVRGTVEAFPDFSSFSAMSLGLNKNREKAPPVFHKSLSRPASSASLYQTFSRSGSRSDLLAERQPASVDSRPTSSCSNASGPLFKRRKRKLESTIQTTVPPAPGKIGGPSSSGLVQMPQNPVVLPSVAEEKPLFLAKDLAMDHRPVMNATHSGRNAAPEDTTAPSQVTRFIEPQFKKAGKDGYSAVFKPGELSPVEVVQFAIMRHLFTDASLLSHELKQAFAYINTPEEPVLPPPPPPMVVAPPQPTETPSLYRIVPAQPAQALQQPAGMLPPLKIKISRNSISGEPSPAASLATAEKSPSSGSEAEGSPKAKRHKHKKKKKHKKHKRRESEECHIVQPAQEGGLRLKIRFKGPDAP